MPELSDFNIILGTSRSRPEAPISIRGTREFEFNTGGREESPAYLKFTLDVGSIARNVALEVNGNRAGSLITGGFFYRLFLSGGLLDQSVYFPGSYLNDGSNVLTVRVPDEAGDLQVSGIVCHFHQRA